MDKLDVSFTTLRVSNAFHSPLMSGILEKFRTTANKVTYKEPKIPILSNVTGDFEKELFCSADYWCRHIMDPVLFEKSIKALSQKGFNTFIEMGAKPQLSVLGMECLAGSSNLWLPSLNPKKEVWIQLMTSVAQLYTRVTLLIGNISKMVIAGIKLYCLLILCTGKLLDFSNQ
jgi:acyl transferase domain-containing protein